MTRRDRTRSVACAGCALAGCALLAALPSCKGRSPNWIRAALPLAGEAWGPDDPVAEGGAAVAFHDLHVHVVEADGQEIRTVEGLARGDELHPLQAAFVEHAGMQCGFCTPGMIMSAKFLLDAHEGPDAARIKDGIAGNFCRCTGYTKIVESISAAAEALKGER